MKSTSGKRMESVYFPLLLAAGGGVLYHLSQKSVPRDVNPLFALILAYAVGMIVCVACSFFYLSEKSLTETFKESNWAIVGVGISAVAIEVGFLLAYRVGWNLSLAALQTNVVVALVLIPIGVLIFKEDLSLWNVLGVACCLMGLVLISK